MIKRQLTAVLEREGPGFVGLCPELDIASQGDSHEETMANLREAVELFLESANAAEISERLSTDIVIQPFEVTIGAA